MSTKTTTTANFNPLAMSTYNSLQGGLGSTINSYMNNPFSNPFFQTQQQMGYKNAALQNQSSMSNISRNNMMSGISSNSPAMMEMMNNQMRAGTANSANQGFLSPVQNALSMQQNAMGLASQYRPLQTGQTQSQSGLGSWLPQLLGGGLGLLTGGLLGGGGGQTAAQQANVWGSGAMTNMQSPFFSPGGGMPVNGSYGLGMNAPNVGGYNFGSSPFTMGQPSY